MTDGYDAALDSFAFDHAGDPLDPGWSREPDDEHIGTLEMSVEDWRDGETLDERNERIRDRDAATRQADRPSGFEHPSRAERPLVDVAALRRRVRERSVELGYGENELIARPPRGRPTAESRARRLALARIVDEARRDGATLAVLAAATRRSLSVVHELLNHAPDAP